MTSSDRTDSNYKFNELPLVFKKEMVSAHFIDPSGNPVKRPIEIRTNPITWRTCRITFSRNAEQERETDRLPLPPPDAADTAQCPFCFPQIRHKTPQLSSELDSHGRTVVGKSILFPNLFPYGSYSAISLFDNNHFVEIGTASCKSYNDSFVNCCNYLQQVAEHDPRSFYVAITQNHLPSAGGSLIHPHLQVHADRIASNHHRFLKNRAMRYFEASGRFRYLFSDYLSHEKKDGTRYIGATGDWEWMAAFAPEGFYELWGILPGITSLRQLTPLLCEDLARGILNTQRFYRSIFRNGYNLGVLCIENGATPLELRIVILARSNYAPWVRNDHTGYEVMLGDMATFTAPEETAAAARPFWL
ncbi:galactose-1-phosphate uridylyltransferase [Desulfococcaceae bacterium HSG9]|nr:galactose-1-phosphate uridylyltransferase [Desulfococcaceae bacterium HSG9]